MSLQCQAWLVQLSLLSGLSDIALHRHCYESRNTPSLVFWNQAAFLQSKILNQLSREISDKGTQLLSLMSLTCLLGEEGLGSMSVISRTQWLGPSCWVGCLVATLILITGYRKLLPPWEKAVMASDCASASLSGEDQWCFTLGNSSR